MYHPIFKALLNFPLSFVTLRLYSWQSISMLQGFASALLSRKSIKINSIKLMEASFYIFPKGNRGKE